MIQHPLVTETTFGDLRIVATNMRQADRDEVDAASGLAPLEVLRRGRLASAECYTLVTPKGIPAAIFGVLPKRQWGGMIWLLGTDDIRRYALSFHRGMRPQLEAMARRWGQLSAMADARNAVHLRWLVHLGFTFSDPVEYGRLGLPFIPFHKVPDV